MRKLLCVLFFQSAIAIAFGQVADNKIVIGVRDSLYSKVLNENREIWVYVPEPKSPNEAKVNYPVLYLLDGDVHFLSVVGLLNHLSTSTGNEICPQMIVVGILNSHRTEDLMPLDTESDSSDGFTTFLEKELIPFVDKKYPAAPYRMLVGHSLGGLRTVNTLVYHSSLFNSYLAIDPSLGHDIYKWYNKAMETIKHKSYTGKSLYIAMAQTMADKMDTAMIQKDTMGYSRHMRTIMGFSKALLADKSNGLQFAWKYYPDETHGSLPLIATYDGMHAIFSWYNNTSVNKIFDTITTTDEARKIVTNHFEEVSKHMGYKVSPPEDYLLELFYYLLTKGMTEKAITFAELSVEDYPQSTQAKQVLNYIKWKDAKPLTGLLTSGKSVNEIATLCKTERSKVKPEYNVSEDGINTLGYELMEKKKYKDAYTIFKLNTDFFPNSGNAFDSYGECLLKLGKEKEGIAAYKKSLELDPNNTNAQKVIKEYSSK